MWKEFGFYKYPIILDSCDWVIIEISETVYFSCSPYKKSMETSTLLLWKLLEKYKGVLEKLLWLLTRRSLKDC